MAADIIIAALAVFFVGLMVYKTVKKKKKGCGGCTGCQSSGCGACSQKR